MLHIFILNFVGFCDTNNNLYFVHIALNSQIRRDYYRGSQDCLAETRRTSTSSIYSGMFIVYII